MHKYLKKKIKNILSPLLIYHREDNLFYYGNYKGSFNFWRMLVWNLFHFGRLYNKFRFGQLFKLDFKRRKKFKKKLLQLSQSNNNNEYNDSRLSAKFDEFLKCGGVVIENYFSEDKIQKFLDKYKSEIENMKNSKPAEYVNYKAIPLKISNELIELWLDRKLMEIISAYFGRETLAREYPTLFYATVNDKVRSKLMYDKKLKIDEAMGPVAWHVDHSVLLNLHILLEDVTSEDSCMEYIPGTHKFPNMTLLYSDEVIEKFGKKPVKCIGKKGTIYFHQGNTIHRFKTESKSNRLNLTLGFTAGSNILIFCDLISKCLSSGFDLNKLDVYQRRILRGIFPIQYDKGFEINKETLSPTRFKEI